MPRAKSTPTDELLNTKLARPRLHATTVARPRLLAQLDAGLGRKLTLVAAPAGFGKTTLAAAWLITRPEPAAWVTLDSGDNDPTRFWQYVLAAAQGLDPELGKRARTALRGSRAPALEGVLTTFLNDLAQLPRPGILVLDDYHQISAEAVHTSLAFVIEHLPPHLHLVLATRSEPPLPLARLRARGDLTELGPAELRFSTAETEAFLAQVLKPMPSADVSARLEALTEGWAAGLRLLALAAQQPADPQALERRLEAFAGGHRHVVDYLAAEVLAGQSEAVQTFVLQTSFLRRLTGALCDAVTGETDGAARLAQLERDNLFVTPLGGREGQAWYRYHPLFAEAMRHIARLRLGEAEARGVAARASDWHAGHGALDEAVELALAAERFDRAADLIEQLVERQGLRELHTMRRWAEALPVAALEAHPAVSFYQAMATLFTGDRYAPATAAALEAPLRRAQTAWEREANTPQLGRVAALRAVILGWQGEARQAHAAAQEALAQLPEDDVYWRSIGLLTLGIEELQEGRVNTAQSLLIEARALCGASGNEHGRLAATTALAEVAYWQGEFDLARQFYQQVLAEAVGGEEMLDDQGAARLGLSLVAYEQGDLAEAEPLAVEAMVLGQRRHDEDLEARAAVQLARVHQARGQGARGRALLQGLAARLRRRDPLRRLRAGEASLALSAGDGGAAGAGGVGRGDEAEAATRVGQEAEAAVQARLHLAQGQPEAALTLLAPWQTDAHTHGRLRSEIAWLGLRALALASTGDAEGAEAALERALALARPKGFRRALADEGAAMAALLQALGPRLGKRALAAYAAGLLREMGLPRATRGEGVGLGEALSPQEMRVLRLLAAGRSNPEIARELVVSTNTVKTQVQSIFRKLNVTSREAAAEAAREMKLL